MEEFSFVDEFFDDYEPISLISDPILIDLDGNGITKKSEYDEDGNLLFTETILIHFEYDRWLSLNMLADALGVFPQVKIELQPSHKLNVWALPSFIDTLNFTFALDRRTRNEENKENIVKSFDIIVSYRDRVPKYKYKEKDIKRLATDLIKNKIDYHFEITRKIFTEEEESQFAINSIKEDDGEKVAKFLEERLENKR